jgi:aldose 1-epimerase
MVELTCGALRCAIEPRLGGCIAGLWHGGEPVLRTVPAGELTNARQSGCYPLVPFSNRIGQAVMVWEGSAYRLVRQGDEPHAIHGVGWQRPWQVLAQDERMALLAYEHAADSAWPFDFDCSQTLRLDGPSLDLTLAMTNQSQVAAPAGLGWHPWFVKPPGSRLAFAATGRWDMGPDKLPTERRAFAGFDGDCDTLDVDHCFDGWAGSAQLTLGRKRITVRSDLSHLVVCTSPQRGFVAVEPVSHVNNAVQLAASGHDAARLGLAALQPGETRIAHMNITVEELG